MRIIHDFLTKVSSTKNLSGKTVRAYLSDFKNFLDFLHCIEKTIISVAADDIYAYIQFSNGKKQKDTTIKRRIVSLKMLFGFMFDENLITINPFASIKFNFKKERSLPKTMTVNEVRKLLKVLDDSKKNAITVFAKFMTIRDTCLLDLLISTGIRIGEAASVRIDDIILSERVVLIHGKGRKQRLIYISSAETWSNLKVWLRFRKEQNIHSSFLFVNRNFEQLSIFGIENIFKKYVKLAEINTSATPHFLRHTFATNLLTNGADLRSVQEILGHASISTTEIYTEVTMKRKKQVLAKYNYRNKLITSN